MDKMKDRKNEYYKAKPVILTDVFICLIPKDRLLL